MSPVHAIGFDLFNTLITVEPDALTVAIHRLVGSLAQNDLPVDPERFRLAHRRAALHHIAKSRESGRETHNRFWISSALEELGYRVAPDDSRIALAIDSYFSAFSESSHTIPGTRSMLDTLGAHYRLGLLSNFTHGPAARNILQQLDLERYFQPLIISGELGYRKPHERAFRALREGFNLPGAAGILYVGDDPECDVHGARDAGFQPVWTTYVRDRNIPFAPGIPAGPADPIDGEVPRISDWDELFLYLESPGPTMT